jgi:hypothetical protein
MDPNYRRVLSRFRAESMGVLEHGLTAETALPNVLRQVNQGSIRGKFGTREFCFDTKVYCH